MCFHLALVVSVCHPWKLEGEKKGLGNNILSLTSF